MQNTHNIFVIWTYKNIFGSVSSFLFLLKDKPGKRQEPGNDIALVHPLALEGDYFNECICDPVSLRQINQVIWPLLNVLTCFDSPQDRICRECCSGEWNSFSTGSGVSIFPTGIPTEGFFFFFDYWYTRGLGVNQNWFWFPWYKSLNMPKSSE